MRLEGAHRRPAHGLISSRTDASVTDEHRNFRVRKYLRRHAAKHDCRNPAPSVRGHDDEVAASLLGGVYDALSLIHI